MDQIGSSFWVILKNIPFIWIWSGSDALSLVILVAVPLIIGGLLGYACRSAAVKALIILLAVLAVFNNIFVFIHGFTDTWRGLAEYFGVPSFYMLAGLVLGSIIRGRLSEKE